VRSPSGHLAISGVETTPKRITLFFDICFFNRSRAGMALAKSGDLAETLRSAERVGILSAAYKIPHAA